MLALEGRIIRLALPTIRTRHESESQWHDVSTKEASWTSLKGAKRACTF